MHWLAVRLIDPGYNPGSPSGAIPGGGSISEIINTVGNWGLKGAVAGMVVGAVVAGFGRAAGNALAMLGGIGVLVGAGLAAALIGGAGVWVAKLSDFGLAWH